VKTTEQHRIALLEEKQVLYLPQQISFTQWNSLEDLALILGGRLIVTDNLGEGAEERLIRDVYVIVDGSVMFHKSYSKSPKEPALISGFIGAIASFAREITATGVLKKVLIPPVKFVASQVMELPQVIIAILLSEKFPDDVSEELLQAIADVILGKHLTELIDSKGEDISSQVSNEVHQAIVKSIRGYLEKKQSERK
jgi:hypothetical protein